MVDDSEIKELLALGHETRGVEFKQSGSSDDKAYMARVVKACLGMSNTVNGGRILLGADDGPTGPIPNGMCSAHRTTWSHDLVLPRISEYTDPRIELTVRQATVGGKGYVLLTIPEFPQIPILCAKDYPGILRKGACYVRTFRMSETTEIPTQQEMRSMIDLAVEKALGRYVETAGRAGVDLVSTEADRDQSAESDQAYDDQMEEFK